MQDKEDRSGALSLEAVHKAIKAVKEKGWDVNPFTVADELKVPRVNIYRCSDAMKLIVSARGGTFGVDLQTALDFTWQLRELEQQNYELKKKLASTLAQLTEGRSNQGYEVHHGEKAQSSADSVSSQANNLNLAGNAAFPSITLNSLANLTWKELETIYYFRVASLREYSDSLSDSKDGSNIKKSFQNKLDENQQAKEFLIYPVTQSETLPQSINITQSETIRQDFPVQIEAIPAVNSIPDIHSADWMLLDVVELPVQSGGVNTKSPTDTGDMPRVDLTNNEAVFRQPRSIESFSEAAIVDSDELRTLIQSHIENAARQIAESANEHVPHSGNAGAEFEMWLNNPARKKFVGASKAEEGPAAINGASLPFKPRIVPPEIRKACLILGFRPESISYELVQDAWKKAITGTHPDVGGDAEIAVYLNTAKDTLMRWLDDQAPKLGNQFGPLKKSSTPDSTPKNNKNKKNKE